MEAFPERADQFTPSLEEDPALGLPLRAKLEILFAVMLGLFLGALGPTALACALFLLLEHANCLVAEQPSRTSPYWCLLVF